MDAVDHPSLLHGPRRRGLRPALLIERGTAQAGRDRPQRRQSGFTLIELLVTIGIIGVIIAIAVPALRGVRDAGRQVVCLSNLRQLGLTLEAHTQARSNTYPYSPPGEWVPTSPPDEPNGSAGRADHWNLRVWWPGLMHDTAPWREHFRAWLCPGAPRDPQRPWRGVDGGTSLSSYQYSTSFIARPEVWSLSAIADDRMLRPVRAQDVTHPAAKVIFYDSEMAHTEVAPGADPARPMLFADGHADLKRIGDATEPAVNPFTGAATRLHDTRDGVRGHDY